jgi:hypothetical protein
MGADLDGTRTALIIRAMDEEFGETVRLNEPHAGDLSNGPAKTSLVLGITSFALIPASVLVLWVVHGDVQLDTWTVIVYLISLVAAICAGLFGVQGRRLAKQGAPGWVPANIGLVLGIGFIVVTVVGLIVGSIVISIILSHDSL